MVTLMTRSENGDIVDVEGFGALKARVRLFLTFIQATLDA